MGWYHHELASGRDPFADEAAAAAATAANTTTTSAAAAATTSTTTTTKPMQPTCPDGTCVTGVVSPRTKTKTTSDTTTTTTTPETNELYTEDGPIYHLCQKSNWLTCLRIERPYYPPTFWLDGHFTRACCKVDTLVPTGNTYYKASSGDWICLELNSKLLQQMGITIVCHRAPESTKEDPVECLKVYGGISVTISDLVTNIYSVERCPASGTFLTIQPNTTIPRKAKGTVLQPPPSSPIPLPLSQTQEQHLPETASSSTTGEIKEEQQKKNGKGFFWNRKTQPNQGRT